MVLFSCYYITVNFLYLSVHNRKSNCSNNIWCVYGLGEHKEVHLLVQ
jgi:hypothetical protein